MHYIHVDENFLVFLEHGDQPERESSARCLNLINLRKMAALATVKCKSFHEICVIIFWSHIVLNMSNNTEVMTVDSRFVLHSVGSKYAAANVEL